MDCPHLFRFSDEVREALASNGPIVALESTIISHGLPYPENEKLALELESIVRSKGAVPATIALIGGKVLVGLTEADLHLLADPSNNVCTRGVSHTDTHTFHPPTQIHPHLHIPVSVSVCPVYAFVCASVTCVCASVTCDTLSGTKSKS
eukprot:TRINITY_DN9335_c0_g1_i6.p1 TRINITY_DN9335_c0_g1~~TRINITY_DN9335_c0_g1_i6.p1  ORF type:complete len:149 (-),score=10.56 TRINITY_DN9335_c0_g1_i6:402-848(-)